MPTWTYLPPRRVKAKPALMSAGTPVVSMVMVGPMPSLNSLTASSSVFPDGRLSPSITCVAPSSRARSRRDWTLSMPMTFLHFEMFPAAMMADNPTPPRPMMVMMSSGPALVTLMTVPEPVWIPQPRGEKSWSSCFDFMSELTLTTLLCDTIDRLAKEDWPKYRPETFGSCFSPWSFVENTGNSPVKFRSKNSGQYEPRFHSQTLHF